MIKTLQAVFLLFCLFLGNQSSAQQYQFQHETLPCVNKKFTVVAHIFLDSMKNANLTEMDVTSALASINPFFKPIGVSFEVCEFRYHENWSHDIIEDAAEVDEVVTKYHADHRINIYFVTEPNDQASPCGFASLNGIGMPFDGRVFIKKEDCVTPRVLAHELGHFFGLKHTFEGNGAELVNGNNCATSGDEICDTPADPYDPAQDLSAYVNDDCTRFISQLTDANGEYYNPDLGNIMSYYKCDTCGFSWEQLKKMAENYLATSPKFW